jgi:hypothetical protein
MSSLFLTAGDCIAWSHLALTLMHHLKSLSSQPCRPGALTAEEPLFLSASCVTRLMAEIPPPHLQELVSLAWI